MWYCIGMKPRELEEKRREYQEALARALEDIVAILKEIPEVKRIFLFGSYARGRRDLFTDLDLLVIMDTDEPFVKRLERLYRTIGGRAGVDVDILAYTPEEITKMREHGFLRNVLQEGRLLYARE